MYSRTIENYNQMKGSKRKKLLPPLKCILEMRILDMQDAFRKKLPAARPPPKARMGSERGSQVEKVKKERGSGGGGEAAVQCAVLFSLNECRSEAGRQAGPCLAHGYGGAFMSQVQERVKEGQVSRPNEGG